MYARSRFRFIERKNGVRAGSYAITGRGRTFCGSVDSNIWTPREVVVAVGERGHGFRFQIHDPQVIPIGPKRPINKTLSVGRHGGKSVVVWPGGHLTETAAVGVDDRHLCAPVDAVGRLVEFTVEAIEERVEISDAKQDLCAVWRPLRAEDVSLRIREDDFVRGRAGRAECDSGSEDPAPAGEGERDEAIAGRVERGQVRVSVSSYSGSRLNVFFHTGRAAVILR